MDTEKHFSDLLTEFNTGMLVTRTGETMHARPMHVAGLSNDGHVYLATSLASPKIDEIEAQPNVMLTFQSSLRFVMLEGRATITRDRSVIDKLWSDSWKAWFPGGKDDPELCLLEINPRGGEYWDNSGAKGLSYMIEGLKAIFQERKPETDASQHAKVGLD